MVDHQRIKDAFSSNYWCFEHYGPETPMLVPYLRNAIPHIDPESWKERLEFGGIFVNGLNADRDVLLPIPAKVEYYEPKFQIHDAKNYYNHFNKEYVIYEDVDLIVSYKPNRLPSMPAKEQRHFNLKSYLEKHLGQTIHLPSRLDTSTQGMLIASKTERMHGPLQRLFENKRIQKYYLLESSATAPWCTLSVKDPIGKTKEHPVLRTVHGSDPKNAQTDFRKIGDTPFLIAKPLTGRTHQIRVHSSSVGLPIRGDNFYGGAHSSQLHLLSFALSFIHPFSEEKVDIFLPSPLFPNWAKPIYDDLRKIHYR